MNAGLCHSLMQGVHNTLSRSVNGPDAHCRAG